jgi:phenylpropionate dioxygenase-like ring-hydroxylating dioxygenase large terminal subunit
MQADGEAAPADLWPLTRDIDFAPYRRRFATDRYRSSEYQQRERELLWMRVWQIAGRADELAEPGDWKVHAIYDQSFVLVRGRDGAIRGFVNACRHRGNRLCQGTGHSARFTCPYHNWSYGLDGQLLAVARPNFGGTIEDFVGTKDELGLLPVAVEEFAGFIFLNPDPEATPLAGFLGAARDKLAAYRLEDMVPYEMNVRETIASNWKVVLDAFYESYHVQGIHPELVPVVDVAQERFTDLGWHGATTVPFGTGVKDGSDEEEVAAIAGLPVANFPGLAEALPRFAKLVESYRAPDARLKLPAGVTALSLLQRATREALTAGGLDVSGLSDSQMSDYQFWALFPNTYLQVKAGEATVIIITPHADGDPARSVWHVYHLLWLPPEQRDAKRAAEVVVPEDEHFPYFLALEQDYQTMASIQAGLRNTRMTSLVVTRQEPKIAQFHTNLDRWLEPGDAPA